MSYPSRCFPCTKFVNCQDVLALHLVMTVMDSMHNPVAVSSLDTILSDNHVAIPRVVFYCTYIQVVINI